MNAFHLAYLGANSTRLCRRLKPWWSLTFEASSFWNTPRIPGYNKRQFNLKPSADLRVKSKNKLLHCNCSSYYAFVSWTWSGTEHPSFAWRQLLTHLNGQISSKSNCRRYRNFSMLPVQTVQNKLLLATVCNKLCYDIISSHLQSNVLWNMYYISFGQLCTVFDTWLH